MDSVPDSLANWVLHSYRRTFKRTLSRAQNKYFLVRQKEARAAPKLYQFSARARKLLFDFDHLICHLKTP